MTLFNPEEATREELIEDSNSMRINIAYFAIEREIERLKVEELEKVLKAKDKALTNTIKEKNDFIAGLTRFLRDIATVVDYSGHWGNLADVIKERLGEQNGLSKSDRSSRKDNKGKELD